MTLIVAIVAGLACVIGGIILTNVAWALTDPPGTEDEWEWTWR